MKKPGVVLILGIILTAGLLGCKGQAEKEGPETIVDTRKLIEVRCSSCHFSSRVFEKKQPAEYWENIVKRMQAMNMDMITDDEVDRMVEYLQKNNSLTEEEMMQ